MPKKVILVTGGAGHVGSHVIEQLVSVKQNKVISLDNYFTGKTENHIPGAEYRIGHTKNINRLIPETPDIVYHLGEYARISPSFEDVKDVYDMNIFGTFAVVDFCRKRKVKKLVYAGSSTKFSYNGLGREKNPYAFCKATNVDLIKNYGEWYGLPYAICYFYNAFGPRENRTGKYATLIGIFEQLTIDKKPLTIVRPGTQKRNFTYVGDLAKGLILAGEKGVGDGYALYNDAAYSIKQIAESFGGAVAYVDGYPGRTDSGESPKKAREELGWETTVDICDYIAEFKKNHLTTD